MKKTMIALCFVPFGMIGQNKIDLKKIKVDYSVNILLVNDGDNSDNNQLLLGVGLLLDSKNRGTKIDVISVHSINDPKKKAIGININSNKK